MLEMCQLQEKCTKIIGERSQQKISVTGFAESIVMSDSPYNQQSQTITMLDKMTLPPLPEFHQVLRGFNLKKSYQYLLYFAKNQQRIYSLIPNLAGPHLTQTNIPTGANRDFILRHLGDILMLEDSLCWEKDTNGQQKLIQVVILSAQRFIMGLIMLGHVHIYEILIRELMPIFIKIIQRETSIPPYKEEIHKKVRQFCKQTITLLAMWFPKCFYDNSSSSWFKRAVNKYSIAVKFIVYYTNDKIEQFQKTIMELRLNESKTQCAECKHCLDMSGKNYNFLKNIQEIPSIIEEQEHQGSSIRYNAKNSSLQKKKSKKTQATKDSYIRSAHKVSTVPIQSKIAQIQYEGQVSDFQQKKSCSSKLSQRIKKHRQARKQKGRKSLIKNSIKSRMEYFNEKSKIQSKAGSQKNQRKEYSTSHSKEYNLENKRSRYVSENQENSTENLKDSVKEVVSEQKLNSVKNMYQASKDKQKSKYKYLNKGNGYSRSKRQPSTQKVLPTYHSKEDVYQISPSQRFQDSKYSSTPYSATDYEKDRVFCISVFESQIYRSMQKTNKKLFRKECFKLYKKRLVSSKEPWTLEVKCKPKGKKMELKIDLMSEYANKIEASLIQPKHPEILIKQGKNIYFFNFQRGFLPVAFRIGKEEVLLPITLISMLQPIDIKDSWQEQGSEMSEMSNFSAYSMSKVQIKLDTELFKTIYHVAKGLRFSEQQVQMSRKRGNLSKKYLFFGEVILVSIQEVSEEQEKIVIKVHHRGQKNDQKISLILKQMKKCCEKVSSGAKRVKKSTDHHHQYESNVIAF